MALCMVPFLKIRSAWFAIAETFELEPRERDSIISHLRAYHQNPCRINAENVMRRTSDWTSKRSAEAEDHLFNLLASIGQT